MSETTKLDTGDELKSLKSPPTATNNDEFYDAEEGELLKSDEDLLSDNSKDATENGKAPVVDSEKTVETLETETPKDQGNGVEESLSNIMENDLIEQIDEEKSKDLEIVGEELASLLVAVTDDQNTIDIKESDTVQEISPSVETVEKSKDNELDTSDDLDAQIEKLLSEDVSADKKEIKTTDALLESPVNEEITSVSDENSIDTSTTKPNEVPENFDEGAAEDKEDDLLVDCASPKDSKDNQESNEKKSDSETSSTSGDAIGVVENVNEVDDKEEKSLMIDETDATTITEGSDATTITEESSKIEESVVPDLPLPDQKDDDAKEETEIQSLTEDMEVDTVIDTVVDPIKPNESEKEDDSEEKEETAPFKFEFMKKFSSKVEKLTRSELEELLLQKIGESLLFSSENSDLRRRIENQEKLTENLKKNLENVKKQYLDLDMIHKRVMKDLSDRPEAAITPVKITRAVGLQVFQPAKPKAFQSSPNIKNKRSLEPEPKINGNTSPGSEAKRRKTVKITPLRPPLSDKERAMIARQEASEEQKLRTNAVRNITQPSVNVPSSITMTPINGNSSTKQSAQSIDLTDDIDEGNSLKMPKSTYVPPLRNIQQIQHTTLVKTIPNSRIQYRTQNSIVFPNVAPLPATPQQISKVGWKKIPPRPIIKISKVATGIIVSWYLENLTHEHAAIMSYKIYAHEESSSSSTTPSSDNWRHVGDVKALALPMAVTLTQFLEGRKYYFAVRAMDCHKRLSGFSIPKTWA